MKRQKITSIAQILIAALICGWLTIQAQSAADETNAAFGISFDEKTPARFDFAGASAVSVANVEELYAAVNDPANAGSRIVMAAGVYFLSATDSGGAARPFGGRLELQENMMLRGVPGDRDAVVIDASNLPASSYAGAAPVTNTGAIRLGRGSNAVEWLTIRNASSGGGGIIVHLSEPGAAFVRIAHVASYNNPRGIDIRNVGASTTGYLIEAEIVDNDLYNNTRIGTGAGVRIINAQGAGGSLVIAALSGNRSFNNFFGILVENTGSTKFGAISVTSSGDRFYENGTGALVGGGLGRATDNNTVDFTAFGSVIENNNGANSFDRGGLIVIGGENTSVPNGVSNNTATVVLRKCRLRNNQQYDLAAFGARSSPVTIGSPGNNNQVKITLQATLAPRVEIFNSVPDYPAGNNSVDLIRRGMVPDFDFDGDGRGELSVFQPAD